jgi:hypothetical protein
VPVSHRRPLGLINTPPDHLGVIMSNTVTEYVTRTGEVREIHPLTADGILSTAIKGGYRVTREWTPGEFVAHVYRPSAAGPMLIYTAQTTEE